MDLLEKVENILSENEDKRGSVIDETLIYFGDNYNKSEIDFDSYINRLLKLSSSVFKNLGADICVNILKSCREDEIINAIRAYQLFAAEIVKVSSAFKYIQTINIYITPTAISLRVLDEGVSNEVFDHRVNELINDFNMSGVALAKFSGNTGENKLVIKLNYKNLEKVNTIFKKKEAVCDGII